MLGTPALPSPSPQAPPHPHVRLAQGLSFLSVPQTCRPVPASGPLHLLFPWSDCPSVCSSQGSFSLQHHLLREVLRAWPTRSRFPLSSFFYHETLFHQNLHEDTKTCCVLVTALAFFLICSYLSPALFPGNKSSQEVGPGLYS